MMGAHIYVTMVDAFISMILKFQALILYKE